MGLKHDFIRASIKSNEIKIFSNEITYTEKYVQAILRTDQKTRKNVQKHGSLTPFRMKNSV